jgi:hypothetical protein
LGTRQATFTAVRRSKQARYSALLDLRWGRVGVPLKPVVYRRMWASVLGEAGAIGVDEARRHDLAAHVQALRRLGAAERAHRLDPVAPGAEVRPEPGVAGAVDDLPA